MTVLARIAGWLRAGTFDPWLVLALGALAYLPGLGAHDLWNPDEPRYGEVCREMRESGDYLVPQLNGRRYGDKPPLMFWAICASAAVRGQLDETAVRWPSAAAGVLGLLVVYAMGSTLFGRGAARIAVLIAASCFTLSWQGRVGQIDMLLLFLVLCGMLAWIRAHVREQPSLCVLFFVAAGFATLAKGPVGLLPPLLSIVVFLVATRDTDGLKRLRLGRGLLVWAAIVLAWLIPAAWSGGAEYLHEIVLRQNVTRFVDPWGHRQPWYYFGLAVPMDFMPWSFFLPAGLMTWWMLPPGETRRRGAFLLTWASVTILFFSVSPGKRGIYVLAVYPALALLLGAALDRIAASWRETSRETAVPGRGWLAGPAVALAATALATTIAVPVIAAGRPEAEPLGDDLPRIIALVFAPLAASSALTAGLFFRRRLNAGVAVLAGGMIATTILAFSLVLPRFDQVKSARALADIVAAEAGPDEPIGVYPRLDPTFLFYAERFLVPLESPDELRAFASRPGRIWLLAERDALAKLDWQPDLFEVARDNDLVSGYILFTSERPREESAES